MINAFNTKKPSVFADGSYIPLYVDTMAQELCNMALAFDPTVEFNGNIPNQVSTAIVQGVGNTALNTFGTLYVDKNRTDSYVENGSINKPYKLIQTALDFVNAQAVLASTAGNFTTVRYIVNIGSGTYTENLTINNPYYCKLQLNGTVLMGTITADTTMQSAPNEVVTLAVTDGCTASGNLTVTVRGVSATIAVLDTDNLASEVATKIRAGTYAGWTTGGTGANVTFTATTLGIKTGTNSLGVASTGVVGTIAVTSEGGDNYQRIDIAGATQGNRAYRGKQAVIKGDIILKRNNDSLIYMCFSGLDLACNVGTVDHGTWVLDFNNCYGSDNTKTIGGTFQPITSEVITLTVTDGCTASGNLTVTVRGVSATIAVVDTDNLASEVATKIGAGTWAGWTPVVVDNVVTFTAQAGGAKTGVSSIVDETVATGVLGTIATPTVGYDADTTSYVLLESQGQNKLLQTWGGKVIFYNVEGMYFNAVNTTPFSQHARITNSTFNSTVSMVSGSAKNLVMDIGSANSLLATTTPTLTNYTIVLTDSELLPELASAPTAIDSFGRLYTKSDNKIYFQDGAGVSHEIAFV